VSCVLLIAPTTPPQRARAIAEACSGFVYLLARAGVTGQRSALPADLPSRIGQLRQVTNLPIAVGFGISTPQQVRQVAEHADAAIVGSAIVGRLVANRQDPAAAIRQAAALVSDLARALPQPSAAAQLTGPGGR
jgi:tryptophan synthase alpha chain